MVSDLTSCVCLEGGFSGGRDPAAAQRIADSHRRCCRGCGIVADPILFDPDLQSAKLIAVWDEIEPLPPAYREAATAIILLLIGIGRAFIYSWLAPAWPNWPGALR